MHRITGHQLWCAICDFSNYAQKTHGKGPAKRQQKRHSRQQSGRFWTHHTPDFSFILAPSAWWYVVENAHKAKRHKLYKGTTYTQVDQNLRTPKIAHLSWSNDSFQPIWKSTAITYSVQVLLSTKSGRNFRAQVRAYQFASGRTKNNYSCMTLASTQQWCGWQWANNGSVSIRITIRNTYCRNVNAYM